MTATSDAQPHYCRKLLLTLRAGKTATAVTLCVLLSAACSSLVPVSDSATTQSEAQRAAKLKAQRNYHDSINLEGRLSVQYRRNDNDESLHASFTWQQTPAHSMLTILSPLGQILATIETRPDGATLIESGHPPRTADDVDTLAMQALGWPLPVSGLHKWLQGFATTRDNQAFIASPDNTNVTTRDGWQIQYPDWQQTPAGDHPKRIDLTRLTEQAGKVSIRIVIDRWQPQ